MGQRPDNRSRARRAFTVVEVMIVLLIMSIIAVIALDAVATFEANQRADRAAREVLALFRYARSLAMTTGKDTKVVANPASNALSFSIYTKTGTNTTFDTTPVSTGMTSTGTWVVAMNASRELVGTTFTLTATPSSNTVTTFNYSALGNCTMNAGADTTTSLSSSTTITFTYATKSKSLVIKRVGDPTLQ